MDGRGPAGKERVWFIIKKAVASDATWYKAGESTALTESVQSKLFILARNEPGVVLAAGLSIFRRQSES